MADTIEDKIPRVYIVLKLSLNFVHIDKVFLTKEEANSYQIEQNKDSSSMYFTESFPILRHRRKQRIPISDPYVITKQKYESLWTRIINYFKD